MVDSEAIVKTRFSRLGEAVYLSLRERTILLVGADASGGGAPET